MKSLKSRNMSKSGGQGGFTIIELVVVILLLGILTATALPRFIDVSDEAHDAVVDAVTGGLLTANALYRAEFIGQGGTNATVAGYPGIAASVTTGYPNITDTASCVTAYSSMLQPGRPTIAAAAGAPATSAAAAALLLPGGNDFRAAYTSSENTCVLLYTANIASGSAATDYIVWAPTTGELVRQ